MVRMLCKTEKHSCVHFWRALLFQDTPPQFLFSCEVLQIMSNMAEMKEETEEISPKIFKGKPPKCYKCGAIGHVEK